MLGAQGWQSLSGRLGTSLCTTPGAKGAGSAGPRGAPRSGWATEEGRQRHLEGGRPCSALAMWGPHRCLLVCSPSQFIPNSDPGTGPQPKPLRSFTCKCGSRSEHPAP